MTFSLLDYSHAHVLTEPGALSPPDTSPAPASVVEVFRPDASPSPGHVPGSIGLLWDDSRDTRFAPDDFAALAGRLGLTPETTVTFVARDSSPAQAVAALWTFLRHGHRRVRLLHGGLTRWVREKRPLASTFFIPTPTAYPAPLQPAAPPEVATPYELMAATAHGAAVLAAGPRGGELAAFAAALPGARLAPSDGALRRDGTFRSADLLAQLYEQRFGLHPAREVLLATRELTHAAVPWFALTLLLGFARVRIAQVPRAAALSRLSAA